MAIYNLDTVNEQLNENSILDSLEEACDYMMNLLEDKSDIDAGVEKRLTTERERSKHGNPKRPKISKDMNEFKKQSLYYYDHGSSMNTEPNNAISTRHAAAARDHMKNDASLKKSADEYNDDYKDFYKRRNTDKDRVFLNRYDGADTSRKKKAIKETCLHILSIIDDIE